VAYKHGEKPKELLVDRPLVKDIDIFRVNNVVDRLVKEKILELFHK
jgi:hypothetical protein